MQNLEQCLDEFLTLRSNWDGYRANPISGLAVDTAKKLTVIPTAQGGVQFELHAGGGDVEIEIDAKGQVVGVLWYRSE